MAYPFSRDKLLIFGSSANGKTLNTNIWRSRKKRTKNNRAKQCTGAGVMLWGSTVTLLSCGLNTAAELYISDGGSGLENVSLQPISLRISTF